MNTWCIWYDESHTPLLDPMIHNKKKLKKEYFVNLKVCKLVIDGCSSKNIVAKGLVDHLKLKTKPHSHLYNIGWIKKKPSVRVMKQCRLPLSLRKTCKVEILCDVVEIEACHVFLGRLWQYDECTTHKV